MQVISKRLCAYRRAKHNIKRYVYLHQIFFAENVKAVLVISLISKFVSAVAWAVVYLHSTEVFPTSADNAS